MYSILKPIIRFALLFYTDKVSVFFNDDTTLGNPKIIASNHPNSFFDAILIAIFYPKPIYFLARGDAFKKPLISKFLKLIHLIPIFRISEGISNLAKNTETFNDCISLLKKGETILIFSEGNCVNEWKLRSLKKGTARLALMAIEAGIENLKIQPANLNYASFTNVPKNIVLNFNKEFEASKINYFKESDYYTNFNSALKEGIIANLIPEDTIQKLNVNQTKNSNLKKMILAMPAFFGWLTQKWFYNLIENFVAKKTKNTVFYDSVLFGILLISYPILIVIISLLIGFFFGFLFGFISFTILPLLAYTYKVYKTI